MITVILNIILTVRDRSSPIKTIWAQRHRHWATCLLSTVLTNGWIICGIVLWFDATWIKPICPQGRHTTKGFSRLNIVWNTLWKNWIEWEEHQSLSKFTGHKYSELHPTQYMGHEAFTSPYSFFCNTTWIIEFSSTFIFIL